MRTWHDKYIQSDLKECLGKALLLIMIKIYKRNTKKRGEEGGAGGRGGGGFHHCGIFRHLLYYYIICYTAIIYYSKIEFLTSNVLVGSFFSGGTFVLVFFLRRGIFSRELFWGGLFPRGHISRQLQKSAYFHNPERDAKLQGLHDLRFKTWELELSFVS